jgi:hypothetical protein
MWIWYWLRWICVFVWCRDLNTILPFIFPLCWTYISSLWCRLACWGRLVDVSYRGRLRAYSSFYALISESCLLVLWLGCWGFLFMFRFMFEEPLSSYWWCMWDLIYDFMLFEMLFLLWLIIYMIKYVDFEFMKSNTLICSYNYWIILFKLVMWGSRVLHLMHLANHWSTFVVATYYCFKLVGHTSEAMENGANQWFLWQ